MNLLAKLYHDLHITAHITAVDERPDALLGDWPEHSRHFRVTYTSPQLPGSITAHYTQGPAITTAPDPIEILALLLDDDETFQNHEDAFEFAENYGLLDGTAASARKAVAAWHALDRLHDDLILWLGPHYDTAYDATLSDRDGDD